MPVLESTQEPRLNFNNTQPQFHSTHALSTQVSVIADSAMLGLTQYSRYTANEAEYC